MDTVSIILIIVSILLNLVLAFSVRNLLRQNEALEDFTINVVESTKEKVTQALTTMKNADIRGSFEADDEVGSAFKDITAAINDLNEKF